MKVWKALRLLWSLPMVEAVAVARLQPGDVVVIESLELLSPDAIDHIGRAVLEVFPASTKVLVLDRRLTMKVIGAAPAA